MGPLGPVDCGMFPCGVMTRSDLDQPIDTQIVVLLW